LTRSEAEGAELAPDLGIEARRTLAADLAVVGLQPEGQSGDKEKKEQQSGHGSNPSCW
jgi:hypothetical protein